LIETEEPRRISRHHCLLDINPPDVRIRDFGSRNGTYVNDKLIGRRNTAERMDADANNLPTVDLQNGDEIRIREMVMRVDVESVSECDLCAAEYSAPGPQPGPTEPSICPACQESATTDKPFLAPPPPLRSLQKICTRCKADCATEIGVRNAEDYVCRNCRRDPLEILRGLLGKADEGKPELAALQGYTIVKELGRGGFGVVCLAHREATGEDTAFKIMLPQVAADRQAVESFLREMRITQALRHPNVVRLRNAGSVGGVFFMSLDYCNSGGLNKLVESRGGKLQVDEAAAITLDVLSGLIYAHKQVVPVKLAGGEIEKRRGVVHRDLKPANIFLHMEGNQRIAKIGDYGLAKAFDSAGLSGHTMAGAVAGTPVFMCRQQVVDFKNAQPAVDVWAVAATMYYLLTGRYPRDFSLGSDVWQTVLQDPPISIRERSPLLPKPLAKLLDTAIDDRKKLAYNTAKEFKHALLKVL